MSRSSGPTMRLGESAIRPTDSTTGYLFNFQHSLKLRHDKHFRGATQIRYAQYKRAAMNVWTPLAIFALAACQWGCHHPDPRPVKSISGHLKWTITESASGEKLGEGDRDISGKDAKIEVMDSQIG